MHILSILTDFYYHKPFSIINLNKSIHISLDLLKEPETQTEKQHVFVVLSCSRKTQERNFSMSKVGYM